MALAGVLRDDVVSSVARIGKSLMTHGALEGLLPCVLPLVGPQILAVCEKLLAGHCVPGVQMWGQRILIR